MTTWVTLKEDQAQFGKHEVDEKKLSEIMSAHPEMAGYEIGEDNEGQLIIYTGLYKTPLQNLL